MCIIPVESESNWPKGLGGVSTQSKLLMAFLF